MSLSSTELSQLVTIFPQNVIADKEGAACRPSCSDVKVAGILQARIGNKIIGSSEISRKTVNGRQSFVKKRDRISQDYEVNKESLEKSYQLEVAIIRVHLTSSMQADRLEKLKREHANKLKELELGHPTAKNPIQHDTESFVEKVDGHSFEGNAHHYDSFDAIDNVHVHYTEANGRRCVHKVENRGSEVSQTKAATQAQGSNSSRKVASSHPEENNETAYSRSPSRSTEGALDAVELGGGATSARINQNDVLPGNTLLEEIDLGKEMSGEAEKDTFHRLSPPISSGEGAEDMTSHDVLTSGASAIKVFSDNAREAGIDKEIPSSEMSPHEEAGAFPSVEVPQSSDFRKTSVDDCGVLGIHSMAVCSTEDQNRDGSDVLESPEPTRATAGTVSPSHCQEGMVSENPTSDAYEDAQIRDVHREVTCRSEFPSRSAPGSPPVLPPLSTNKNGINNLGSTSAAAQDGSGQDQEQPNNLQESELERPNSLNCISSDCGVAQIHPVVQSQISEAAFPPPGPQNVPLADEIEIKLHQDALISLQDKTGTHGAPDSRTAVTQTSLQPMAHAAADSLGMGGGHIGYSPLPSIIPPQPLVQGAVERPSPDPLDNELEKLKRAEEINDQTYADLNLRLKSECDREIQEIVARINAKYDLKQKEVDAAYKLKKNGLGSCMDRVNMHINLVEALRIVASCPQLQQGGVPVNAPHQSFDVLSSAGGSQTPSLGASSRSLPPITSPARAVTLIRPRSTHPMVINSQSPTPALLHANHTLSRYSSVPSRPLINSTSPARNMMAPISTAPPMASRNITMEGTCAPSPHLQPFRPQAGPILQESYLSGNLSNRHMSLAGNFSSYPTSHIPNQVIPPPKAVRPWVRDSTPGSSGSADFVSLSDDD